MRDIRHNIGLPLRGELRAMSDEYFLYDRTDYELFPTTMDIAFCVSEISNEISEISSAIFQTWKFRNTSCSCSQLANS